MVKTWTEGSRLYGMCDGVMYRTNEDKEGLWVLGSGNSEVYNEETGKYEPIKEWKQIKGTPQLRGRYQLRKYLIERGYLSI